MLIALGLAACAGEPSAQRGQSPSIAPRTSTSDVVAGCGDLAGPHELLLSEGDSSRGELWKVIRSAGVVVAARHCGGIRVLAGCTAIGSYAFAGVKREGGSSGRWATTVAAVHGEEVWGGCEGATHFVRWVDAGGAEADSTPPSGTMAVRMVPLGVKRPPEKWVGGETDGRVEERGDGTCEEGNASACARNWRAGGEGGLQHARRGCALGDAAACEWLAERGDPGERHAAWRRACEGGAADKCWAWGRWAEGDGEGRDGEEGERKLLGAYMAYVRGCQTGSGVSCLEAVRMRSAVNWGPAESELLEASCEAGRNWEGCMVLAERLKGTDRGKAESIYGRVCDMKIMAGCREGARLMGEGSGALELWGRGCRLGDGESCMEAGARESGADAARGWFELGCGRYRYEPACARLK